MRDPKKHKLSEIIAIDDELDTVSIYGRQFDGDILRGFAMVFPVGISFRVTTKEDGTVSVTIEQ